MKFILIQCFLIILIYATGWFVIAVYKKRNDVADIAWGIGYILICVFLLINYPTSAVSLLLYSLITLWGLRLSIHIYFRNKNKQEDFRYLSWRKEWGKTFYWRSYFQVFLLQGILLLIILSPVIHSAVIPNQAWNTFTWIGTGCWLIGFYIQAVADRQLSVFIKQQKSKGNFLQSGLWKYSRHPNYFGEIMMWWGIFIITIPIPDSIIYIISPLTITILLVFVSGIPMLEKRYTGNPEFEAYKKRTSMLVPMPPKKN